MSKEENIHHRERVKLKRKKELKQLWHFKEGDELLEVNARLKHNPFTACSCWMCSEGTREEHKRDRQQAKKEINEQLDGE